MSDNTRPVAVMFGGAFDSRPPEAVKWLWEPYLAFGFVSVLDGDPGVGKSLVAIDLAARAGTGRPMPGGAPPAINPMTREACVPAVLVTAEDSVDRTLAPRMMAAGGNMPYTAFVGDAGRSSQFRPIRLPGDLAALEDLLYVKGLPVGAFVVLDPFMGLLSRRVAANSDQAVRAAIAPLARVAAQTSSCILLIRHLNKSGAGRSLYRGTGSIGIVGAARTALLAARHPDDPDRRVLSMTKSNLGPVAPSLGFRVAVVPAREVTIQYKADDPHPDTGQPILEDFTSPETLPAAPVVAWDGPTPLTADDLCANVRDQSGFGASAVDWLKETLRNGPVPATVIETLAFKEGFGYRTIQFAKARLGVESRRVKVAEQTRWEWFLPELNGVG